MDYILLIILIIILVFFPFLLAFKSDYISPTIILTFAYIFSILLAYLGLNSWTFENHLYYHLE